MGGHSWGTPTGLAAPACALAVLAVAASVAGCGGSGGAGEAAAKITVAASDTACKVSKTSLPAGSHTFSVKSTGTQITEFEVLRPDGRIVSERENIGPGTTIELTTWLTAGEYQAACIPGMSGKGLRTKLTVAGASTQKRDPGLDAAVDSYRTYVFDQVDDTVATTKKFTAAVKAGDVAKAKKLYAPSRYGWESIEPVAESFGDIDPKVDLREADLEDGQTWTGWHVIEKSLWTKNSTKGMAVYADKLNAELQVLRQRVGKAEITPTSMANGAKELLDEVATGKVTGEEEAFSHTDLVDFEANVLGAKKAYTLLRPVVVKRDKALATTLDREFTTVLDAIKPYERGDGYLSYDKVTKAQRKELSDKVNALAEPLSKLAAVVAK